MFVTYYTSSVLVKVLKLARMYLHTYKYTHIQDGSGVVMANNLREEINQLHANVCDGLADPIRILLLYTLSDAPCNVNDLSERVNLPQPTVSRHLKILRERGMVVAQRDGQFVYYRLADRRVIEALDLLRAMMADHLKERAQIASTAETL
jgi:ArsR family transcriptional regulator